MPDLLFAASDSDLDLEIEGSALDSVQNSKQNIFVGKVEHGDCFFGRTAEVCGRYLKKGSQAYIEGSIRTRKYMDKEGVASDAETLEHARALLAHADSRTTERVYRRKPERVKPLR